jgi:TolB-like protein/tetratricopeptide (TPR) repeat protein
VTTRLGRYLLDERIGAGGMAEVFLARQSGPGGFERRCVIKRMLPQVSADPSFVTMFVDEARVSSQLNHPNIAQVYDFGQEAGIYFLAMEHVPGCSLRQVLRARVKAGAQIPARLAAALVQQICLGLEYAHNAVGSDGAPLQVIHRDISPQNVMVSPKGAVKVIDFGIAKAKARLTQTAIGTVKGNFAYMSPEQVRGESVDPRADLYSTGLVLYELLSGRPAIQGKDEASLMEAAYNPRIAPLPAGIPEGLRVVVEKAASLRPYSRFQSAAEMGGALRKFLGTLPEVSPEELGSLVPEGPVQIVTGPPRAGQWGASDPEAASTQADAAPAGSRPVAWRWLRTDDAKVLGVALVTLGLVLGGTLLFGPHSRSGRERPGVAVLGFRDASGAPRKAWISTALSELIGTDLAAAGGVRVVSGEEVASMRRDLSLRDGDVSPATLSRISKNLGVQYVLAGSFFASDDVHGEPVVIDAGLLRTSDGVALVSLRLVSQEAELADASMKLGKGLRTSLGLPDLVSEETRRVRAGFAARPDAARDHAEGLAALRRYDLVAARDALQRAVAEDPQDATAWEALSEAWKRLGYGGRAQEAIAKAESLADRLTPGGRLTIQARAAIEAHDWRRAAERYHALIALDPTEADSWIGLSNAVANSGDNAASVRVLEPLIPPLSEEPRVAFYLAQALGRAEVGHARELESARRAVERARAAGATTLLAWSLLIQSQAEHKSGDSPHALADCDDARLLCEGLQDPICQANALRLCGSQRLQVGQIDSGRALIGQAIAIASRIHAGDLELSALNDLGLMSLDQGRVSEARTTFMRAVELARQLEMPSLGALPQFNVASADVDLASPDAEHELVTASETTQVVGLKTTVRLCALETALLHHRTGRLELTRKEWEEALAGIRADGSRLYLAAGLVDYADTLIELGERDAAKRALDEAKVLAVQVGAGDIALVSRSELAALDAEPEHFTQVVADEQQTADELARSKEWDNAANAFLRLARTARSRGKLDEARRAVVQARSQPTEVVFTLLEAEVESARLDQRQGPARLEAVRQRADRVHYPQPALEARLALADLEQAAGNRAHARALKTAVARDAGKLGYERIARLASPAP